MLNGSHFNDILSLCDGMDKHCCGTVPVINVKMMSKGCQSLMFSCQFETLASLGTWNHTGLPVYMTPILYIFKSVICLLFYTYFIVYKLASMLSTGSHNVCHFNVAVTVTYMYISWLMLIWYTSTYFRWKTVITVLSLIEVQWAKAMV